MKKIIISTLMFLIVGCNFGIPTGPHRFIVTDKQIYEKSDMAAYKVDMPDNSRIGSISFWFSDKKDKFNVGDILLFQKQE